MAPRPIRDHPEDPECLGPNDNTEAVECSDGLDGDGDGLIDYPFDPECTSAAEPTFEQQAVAGLIVATWRQSRQMQSRSAG